MEIGFIGLGRMGLNMVRRLVSGGHRVVCMDRIEGKKAEAEAAGAIWAPSETALLKSLQNSRKVWVMVPSGQTTEDLLLSLAGGMQGGDMLIDGGNSDYRDTIRRGKKLAELEIGFIDSGTSGGIWGMQNGYCLTIGGAVAHIDLMAPVFETLAPPNGWARMGDVGSGHYVKMVHNAIEYGMMQAYAEGFDLLEHSGLNLDLGKISTLWNQGSIVRSWLLELAEGVFYEDPHLDALKGHVDDSGECRWAVETAISRNVPVPVLALSLFTRFASRQENAFSNRFLAALRSKFGGHAVKKAE